MWYSVAIMTVWKRYLSPILHNSLFFQSIIIRNEKRQKKTDHYSSYIVNVKKSCSILQQFTGRKCVTLYGVFLCVIIPIDHISLTLDGVTSFLLVENVRNTCKRLRYSQLFGWISSVQWRKVGRIWRIQLLFQRFLCVRIERDQV